MIINVLVWVSIIMMICGVVWAAVCLMRYFSPDGSSRRRRSNDGGENQAPSRGLKWPASLFIVGLVLAIWMGTGAAWVQATHIAVVENTFSGEFSSIGPGTHIWPAQPRLIPFVTKTTKYSLRYTDGFVEIGSPPDGKTFDTKYAIEADSNSPGRPSVYFWARVWSRPNPEKIVELHRQYGSKYLHDWIERVYIAALKSVQGRSEYYYVGQNRVDFQHEVEKALQKQLLDKNDFPIVEVQQLAVVNFKFAPATDAFLQTVQKIEFDRQQAEQQIQVNKKQQEAQKIAADTAYIVETRNAERDRDANISRATGTAQAVKLTADADAYKIEKIYTAESEGIRKVQIALAQSPAAYLQYQQTKQWDGKLPQYMLGSGVIPFLDLSPDKTGFTK